MEPLLLRTVKLSTSRTTNKFVAALMASAHFERLTIDVSSVASSIAILLTKQNTFYLKSCTYVDLNKRRSLLCGEVICGQSIETNTGGEYERTAASHFHSSKNKLKLLAS
jgi:hypothetical protein